MADRPMAHAGRMNTMLNNDECEEETTTHTKATATTAAMPASASQQQAPPSLRTGCDCASVSSPPASLVARTLAADVVAPDESS